MNQNFYEEEGVGRGLLNVLSLLRSGILSREELVSKLEKILIYPF